MTKDEGGRYTPFTEGYRPQLFLRTADVTAALTFPEGTPDAAEKMVIPGDNVEMVGTLVHEVAIEPGSRYVRELVVRRFGFTRILQIHIARRWQDWYVSTSKMFDVANPVPQSALV